jgi:hypothetical protein
MQHSALNFELNAGRVAFSVPARAMDCDALNALLEFLAAAYVVPSNVPGALPIWSTQVLQDGTFGKGMSSDLVDALANAVLHLRLPRAAM